MKDVFSMWGKTKMVVLVALCAGLYAALLIPFKGFVLIPGVTEFRPASALPVVMGLLFGPAGAWGSAIGNLIGDFFGSLGVGSLFGFFGNFIFAYTSGVLAMALHRQSEGILRRQFQDRRTGKVYLALVEGMMPEDRGRIDLPLVRDWPNRPRQKVCFRTGRPSLTLYETVRREEDVTLVRLFPHIGRSHQLRVHLASLGHPIVGDNLYGPDPSPSSRLMLHASQLELFHPRSRKWLVFTTCYLQREYCTIKVIIKIESMYCPF